MVDVGNMVFNVILECVEFWFNICFNDIWLLVSLKE